MLAVPVAPPDTIERLRPEVDEVVCLMMPAFLGAIGSFYRDFRQLDDDEVIRLLEQAAPWAATPTPCEPEAEPASHAAVAPLAAVSRPAGSLVSIRGETGRTRSNLGSDIIPPFGRAATSQPRAPSQARYDPAARRLRGHARLARCRPILAGCSPGIGASDQHVVEPGAEREEHEADGEAPEGADQRAPERRSEAT